MTLLLVYRLSSFVLLVIGGLVYVVIEHGRLLALLRAHHLFVELHATTWLLAAAIFVVYWMTLNHGVTLFNYLAVAKISGWIWQPEVYNPIFIVVTYPFQWLSPAQIPTALNLFSAMCAALTLGLLARSVAILLAAPYFAICASSPIWCRNISISRWCGVDAPEVP